VRGVIIRKRAGQQEALELLPCCRGPPPPIIDPHPAAYIGLQWKPHYPCMGQLTPHGFICTPPPPNVSRRIKLYCLYVYGNGPKLSSVSLPRLCECGLRTFRSNVPSSVRKMASVVSSKRWCTFLPGHMTLIDINVVFLLQMCLFFISLIV